MFGSCLPVRAVFCFFHVQVGTVRRAAFIELIGRVILRENPSYKSTYKISTPLLHVQASNEV